MLSRTKDLRNRVLIYMFADEWHFEVYNDLCERIFSGYWLKLNGENHAEAARWIETFALSEWPGREFVLCGCWGDKEAREAMLELAARRKEFMLCDHTRWKI